MNHLEGQKALARANPRRRSMFMLRGGEDQPCQVMFNTIMKDSEPPIHRHTINESFMVIEGEFELWIFPEGSEKPFDNMEVLTLLPGNSYEVQANTWHTFRCKTESGIVMEFKNCYYQPETDKEIYEIRDSEV